MFICTASFLESFILNGWCSKVTHCISKSSYFNYCLPIQYFQLPSTDTLHKDPFWTFLPQVHNLIQHKSYKKKSIRKSYKLLQFKLNDFNIIFDGTLINFWLWQIINWIEKYTKNFSISLNSFISFYTIFSYIKIMEKSNLLNFFFIKIRWKIKSIIWYKWKVNCEKKLSNC